MKKNYKQPSVEVAAMLTGSIVMAGSPGIGFSGDPISNSGSGD